MFVAHDLHLGSSWYFLGSGMAIARVEMPRIRRAVSFMVGGVEGGMGC